MRANVPKRLEVKPLHLSVSPFFARKACSTAWIRLRLAGLHPSPTGLGKPIGFTRRNPRKRLPASAQLCLKMHADVDDPALSGESPHAKARRREPIHFFASFASSREALQLPCWFSAVRGVAPPAVARQLRDEHRPARPRPVDPEYNGERRESERLHQQSQPEAAERG